MRYKILVTALVLFVLALVMLAPVAAQNDVVVDQTSDETNMHNWNESVDHNEWLIEMGVGGYTSDYMLDAWGWDWGYTTNTYHNEYQADFGGGTGSSTNTVDATSWSQVDTTETTDTLGSPAPGVLQGSHTEVTTHDDWWSDFNSETNTTWSPTP